MFHDLISYIISYSFWILVFAIAIFLYIDDKKKQEVKQKKEQDFTDYLHSINLGDSMSDIFTYLNKPTSSSILKDGTEKYEWVWSDKVPQKRTIVWSKDGRVTSVSHINI